MKTISFTELPLNADNSVYHLNLLPEDISNTIILVGDKERVSLVSSFFDKVELKKEKREFFTHTGIFNGKRLSVISTGIGPDNIDIAINELDALVNINLFNRTHKETKTSLKFIRIGTSGTIQEDIPINSAIVADFSMGLDNLLSFYKYEQNPYEIELSKELEQHLHKHNSFLPFYIFEGSQELRNLIPSEFYHGITITAPGFYGPQGRSIRSEIAFPELNNILSNFKYKDQRILNFEMESSAIYGLSRILGHNAVTVDLVLANRATHTFSVNYESSMKDLVKKVLDCI